MKYIFFDIECANEYHGVYKICEFGYVITDENFNVLRKDDIPMSPGNPNNDRDRFDMAIKDRDPKFEWAYEPEYYFEQPRFPHFYKKLKSLLEGEDTIAIGFAVENDIGFLESECNRYKLEQFNFNTCDIKSLVNKHNMRGLESTFRKLCPFNEYISLHPHLSRDDAFMTMRVLQELLGKENMTLSNYVESDISHKINVLEYITNRKQRKLLKKLHPEMFTKRGKHSPIQKAWGEFYRSFLDELTKEDSKGRVITISKTIKYDMSVLNNVMTEIKSRNLVANDRINGSNYMIVSDDADAERMKQALKHPWEGRFITYKEFTGFDLPDGFDCLKEN